MASTVLVGAFSLLKAFSGPVGSIIGDIAGRIEAERLAIVLGLLQARLESLEEADLKRATSEQAKPFLKEVLRLGVQEPDDGKRNIYVDAFANAIRSGVPFGSEDFRGLRVLGEMAQRHLDLLNEIRRKPRDQAGRISFIHQEVEYGWEGNKLGDVQDLQSWGVLLPYQPDTSRQRWHVTGFGDHLLRLSEIKE